MYCPEHFAQDRAFAEALVARFPLGVLVGEGVLCADLVPMLWRGERLIGHVALANDLHRRLPQGALVMAVFQGPQGYISPQWYPSKAEHHRHVPTWNYAMAELHGEIRFSHELKEKRAVVGLMTKHFEAQAHEQGGWRMADAPEDYMAQMLGQIVAFEISLTRVLAKGKLSQNRTPEDLAGASAGVEPMQPDLAAMMRG